MTTPRVTVADDSSIPGFPRKAWNDMPKKRKSTGGPDNNSAYQPGSGKPRKGEKPKRKR